MKNQNILKLCLMKYVFNLNYSFVKLVLSIVCFNFLISNSSIAQRKCATMENLNQLKLSDPSIVSRMNSISNVNTLSDKVTIYIPVVVHVIYNTASENISNTQIQSQIDVLNQDFNNVNVDKVNRPSAFAGLAGNYNLKFFLATKKPDGTTTNGIERKSNSANTKWYCNGATVDDMKRSSKGGLDPWDAKKYLNIWVVNAIYDINSTNPNEIVLGYAQFPGGSLSTDGVVIIANGFGTTGYVQAPINKGRTTTHEVGHWLNLKHIWGDAACGNDGVNDTPTQQTSNYACPSFPHVTCSNGSNGDMFMNYMDYTDDNCMNMFTKGQKDRSRAVLAVGGARQEFLSYGTSINNPIDLGAVPDFCDPAKYYGLISSLSPKLYYKFSIGTPIVSVCNSEFEPKITLYNAAGNLITGQNTSNSSCLYPYIFLDGDLPYYIVSVEPKNVGQGGNFELVIAASGACRKGVDEFTNDSLSYLKSVVYPNPSDDGSISINVSTSENANVLIYNTTGTLIKSKDIDESELVYFDDLESGVYVVRVSNNSTVVTQKLVVK